MGIDTSINTTRATRETLLDASIQTGKSQCWIIIFLMKQMMKNHQKLGRANRGVERQEVDENEDWKALHICVCPRDHDLFMDMKKFFKRTVSLLVAMAVGELLEGLVRRILARKFDAYTDNYSFNNYFIILQPLDGALCWKIFWGKPIDSSLLSPP
ncbi:MAG: hypothetical protein EPN93_07115 [Spirochaetes bacterium]|nr:MAG: hypothetical protein EPN93_07115 [Spirochaetota bacterium]